MPASSPSPVRRPSRLRVGLRRFARHPLGIGALSVIVVLVLIALVVPHVWPYAYSEITPDLSEAPSLRHPMGTDSLGRDLFAMVLRGLQQSLLIAFSVTVVASLLGVTLGVVSGFFSGATDTAIMRLVDLVLTLPTLAMAAFLGATAAGEGTPWFALALVLGALMWTSMARLVRGVVLGIRELPYIDAARVMGASSMRIMGRHLIPNVIDHIIVSATLMFGHAILVESGLSFLGFGVRPPDTSLGLLVADGQSAVLTRPWLFFFPGVLIVLLVLSINYVGDGLREAFNPKVAASNPLADLPASRGEPLPGSGTPTASDGDDLVTVRGLTVRFGETVVVDGIDLRIARGEVLGLVGESGSGKSITAMALVGLLPETARYVGDLRLDGESLIGRSYDQWQPIRGRRIAMILQDPSTTLNPVLSIGAQFDDSIRLGQPKLDQAACRARAVELMESVAIPNPQMRLDQYPHQLSGGLRQRVAIALAMVHSPDLIIADEPTTALDVTVQAQVIATLKLALAQTGAAMLFISHDLALMAGVADRVAVMQSGKVVEEQPVIDLFDNPRHPYTQRLLTLAPRLDRGAAS